MTEFIAHLTKLKKQRLKQLEQELILENQKQLQQLSQQLDAAKKTYSDTKTKLINQAISKLTFSLSQEAKFAKTNKQLQLLTDLWQKTTTDFFSQEKNLHAWLDLGLAQIQGQSGTLKVSVSHSYLAKKIKSSDIKLEKSDQLKTDPGFLFETASTTFDFTLENFLNQTLSNHKATLFANLFAQPKINN